MDHRTEKSILLTVPCITKDINEQPDEEVHRASLEGSKHRSLPAHDAPCTWVHSPAQKLLHPRGSEICRPAGLSHGPLGE